MTSFWLSYTEPLPEKQGLRFLGACLVEAPSLRKAIITARDRGLDPGGKVKGVRVVPHILQLIGDPWKGRLLSRQCCRELDREMNARRKEAPLEGPPVYERA
jgi:hypothetical protein